MKKRILFVVDEKQMGGVSTVLNDLLNLINLEKYKIDVLVLHNRGDQLDNLPESINLFYGTKYFDAIDYTLSEVIKGKNIARIYHKLQIIYDMKTEKVINKIKYERKKMNLPRYDVEIAFKDGFTAVFTASGDALKKIHWLHYEYHECNPNAKYNSLFKRILPEFNVIVGVSKNVLDAFNELYHLDKYSLVIPNVINENRIFQLANLSKERRKNDNKLRLVSIGRLHKVKGYERLINVFKELNEKHLLSNVILDIYGDGPEQLRLQSLINKFELNEIIMLKGRIDNPYSILKNYDLSLVTSLFEAFGLSVVESMLVQVPVLATETAAMHNLIQNNINGWICDNSYKGIKEKLTQLILNQNEICVCHLALSGYHYDNEQILKQIEELLDEV